MSDFSSSVRRVRTFQIGVVVAGMITGFMLPSLGQLGGTSPLMAVASFAGAGIGWLVVPILYMFFARHVDEALTSLGVQLPKGTPPRHLAAGMFLPCIAPFVEVAVLSSLARRTCLSPDDEPRARRVVLLAIGRLISTFIVGIVVNVVFTFGENDALRFVAFGFNAMIALALLAVSTQIIVQPLLDRVDDRGPLGAVSASTSTAFSSSTERP